MLLENAKVNCQRISNLENCVPQEKLAKREIGKKALRNILYEKEDTQKPLLEQSLINSSLGLLNKSLKYSLW